MQTCRRVGSVVALALLAGCGNRDLILRLDIKSFLTPAQSQTAFGPIVAIPGGFRSGEQALVSDARINMLEGLGDAVVVKHFEVTLATIVSASSGTGTDTLRVYASDVNTQPLATKPVLELALKIVPTTSDTVTTVVKDNAHMDSLFTQKAMRLTVTTSLLGPAIGPALNGKLVIHRFDAVAVTGRKLN